jgi:ATP-dependent DNA helicase RecG
MIPTPAVILNLLPRLDFGIAEEIESQWLEFKPWDGPKESMKVAVEYAACFANAEGGAIVFGVADKTRGRAAAIHGARGYNLDTWRRGIYDATNPKLPVTVEEIAVPEGTGRLLVVRVPASLDTPCGTSQGLYKRRVGTNCMPMDPRAWTAGRVASGVVDWSGAPADGVDVSDLDPVEIARARNVLRRIRPESGLLAVDDRAFLAGLGATHEGRVTNAGVVLFGREEVIRRVCPQHQVHYVYQTSPTDVARNDSFQCGLLNILERIEQAFTGPVNPEQELSVGLYKIRIPAYPVEVIREALLNAVTHRNYADPGEVLFRHTAHEVAVTSPGGFIGGITPQNILRHEAVSRNRVLAQAFEKLGLVERAGVGRLRIFLPSLRYGKRMPVYESGGDRVTLRVYDGSFDGRMATLVAKWTREGREIGLDALLVLSHLRSNAFLDTMSAGRLLQLAPDAVRGVLDALAQPETGILERVGRTRAATYRLTKGVAKDLLGKAAYTKTRGINPIRYAELVKEFVQDHDSITPSECRELLGLGDSQSARVEVSRYLRKWSGKEGFLRREGTSPKMVYFPRTER